MPQTASAAEAFGAVTIALVIIFILLAFLSIVYTIHFYLRIRQRNLLSFGYFNGPWVSRIAFSLVAIWWSIWEIIRLSLVSAKTRWQKHACRIYVISNIGVSEPLMLFILVFLLRASLQKREFGVLSRHWNTKTISWALLLALPLLILQLGIVCLGPSILKQDTDRAIKLTSYFWSDVDSGSGGGVGVGGACTYPLFSTALLGLLELSLIIYASFAAGKILSLVVNRRLRRRVSIFILMVDLFLLLRVIFLGLSVVATPGRAAFEGLVFFAFLLQLMYAAASICVVVICPVVDSLALRGTVGVDFEEFPFDDYYSDGNSLVPNNHGLLMEPGRSSDVSTKRGSISFRNMIKMDFLFGPDSACPPG